MHDSEKQALLEAEAGHLFKSLKANAAMYRIKLALKFIFYFIIAYIPKRAMKRRSKSQIHLSNDFSYI